MKQNTGYCDQRTEVVKDFGCEPEKDLGKIEMRLIQISERLSNLQATKDKMEEKFDSVLVEDMLGYGVDCAKEKQSNSHLFEQLDVIYNKIDGLVYQLDSIIRRCEL